jgi:hypothetical protein
MVIAEERLRDWIDARSSQLQQKIMRPCNSTEHHGSRKYVLSNDSAPRPPHSLTLERKGLRGSPASQHYSIGASQRTQRLSQSSRRQQLIARVIRRYQHDIEISHQAAMLKPIIQQMNLRTEPHLSKPTRLVAIFPNDHRNPQSPCD